MQKDDAGLVGEEATWVEKDDGLETGELRLVDLHLPQRLHHVLQHLRSQTGHGQIGVLLGEDGVVAKQENVLVEKGALCQR